MQIPVVTPAQNPMSNLTQAMLNPRLNGSLEGMTIEEVPTTIRQLLGQNEINFYLIGSIYNYVVTHNLAEEAGYKDAPEFFAKEVKELARATLAAYGAVAREFNQEVCVEYGISRLSLLLTYEEASGQQADKNAPGLFPIVLADKNGKPEQKAFADCSVADLRKALQRLRRPTSSMPIPQEDAALIKGYRDSLARKFTEKNSRVQLAARNQKGLVLMTLKDFTLADVRKVIEALMDVLPPDAH